MFVQKKGMSEAFKITEKDFQMTEKEELDSVRFFPRINITNDFFYQLPAWSYLLGFILFSMTILYIKFPGTDALLCLEDNSTFSKSILIIILFIITIGLSGRALYYKN
jgi:hypothetical protein